MRTSKRVINKNLQREILAIFFQVVADLSSPQETETFFADILSEQEIEAIAKRVAIAHYLSYGRSYNNIQENLKVSTSTIAQVEKMLPSPGFQTALKKIEAERWANDWSAKIEKLFKK